MKQGIAVHMVNTYSARRWMLPLRFPPEKLLLLLSALLFVALVALSVWFPGQRAYPYFAYALYLGCSCSLLVLFPRMLRLHRPRLLDLLPLLSLAVWLYGILRGLLGGYPSAAVFSNFAGIVFYGVYYLLLLSRWGTQALLKYTFGMAVLFSLAMTYSMLGGAGLSLQLEQFEEIGLSAVRLGWSSSLSLALVVVAFGYARLVDLLPSPDSTGIWRVGKGASLAAFVGASIPVLGTASKGFILAYGMMLGVLTLARFSRDIRHLRIRRGILLVFLLACTAGVLYIDQIVAVVRVLILLEISADSVRSIQGAELINDFTWLGKGLGASLSSGYSRDALGYGFELTFHNIIHKFGILSLLHLPMLLLPAIWSAWGILHMRNLEINIAAFALMMFIVPGYGNPILHVPLNALLNCLALYLLAHHTEFSRQVVRHAPATNCRRH